MQPYDLVGNPVSFCMKHTAGPYDKIVSCLSPFPYNVYVHIEPSGNNFVDKQLVLYLHDGKNILVVEVDMLFLHKLSCLPTV